ncbi:MAG: glycosyltransferase family 2 protein [Verrucomicrobiales bacterium]|nr:glycosyltransferase family 2 protein [Verrucomicrobiales bacterium]
MLGHEGSRGCNPQRKPILSVVIPAYREADHLGRSLQIIAEHARATGLSFELVVVDDGSPDDTWSAIRRARETIPEVLGFRLSRNFGKECAICAGLEQARGEAVILMDADLQHPPELIGEMVRCWREEGVSVVEAFKERRGTESLFYRGAAHLFYRLASPLTGLDLEKASDYRLLDRAALDAYLSMPERSVFFRGMSTWVGFRRRAIPFSVPERAGGTSSWTVWQLVSLAVSAIVAFSSVPLRLILYLGVLFLLLGLGVGARAVWMYFDGTAVSGFTTVILLQVIMGGIVMIMLGILGEYVGKVFEEVKRRPRYLISERTR